MPTPLRPLSTGELLDRTFGVYRKNILLFIGICFIPYGALLVCRLALASAQRTATVGGAAVAGLAFLAVLIGSIIASGFTQAAVTHAVSSVYLERPVSVSSSYSAVRSRVAATIGVSILFAIAVGVGFMLLIVPGVLVIARYSLGVPATVLEKTGVSKSFARSKQLSAGSSGRVLLIYILVLILYYAIAVGLGAGLGAVLGATKHLSWLPWSAEAIQFAVQCIVAPVITIALTLLYYDQRVRKEAFDLEHMMASLPGGATGSQLGAAAGVSV